MVLPIIKTPDPILRQRAMEVTKEEMKTENFQKFISDMVEIMKESEGIGLAAPQVGVGKKIICIDASGHDQRGNIEKKKYPELIYDSNLILINPRITYKSLMKNIMDEGCLSVPGIIAKVKRPKSVCVVCLNMEGKKIKLRAKGLLARVLQHEIDHLEGVLFTDRIS